MAPGSRGKPARPATQGLCHLGECGAQHRGGERAPGTVWPVVSCSGQELGPGLHGTVRAARLPIPHPRYPVGSHPDLGWGGKGAPQLGVSPPRVSCQDSSRNVLSLLRALQALEQERMQPAPALLLVPWDSEGEPQLLARGERGTQAGPSPPPSGNCPYSHPQESHSQMREENLAEWGTNSLGFQ